MVRGEWVEEREGLRLMDKFRKEVFIGTCRCRLPLWTVGVSRGVCSIVVGIGVVVVIIILVVAAAATRRKEVWLLEPEAE